MASRKLSLTKSLGAFALGLLALGGCYEADDDEGGIAAAIAAWVVDLSGGAASANDGSAQGTGGAGGTLNAVANGELSFGESAAPPLPSLPAAPSGGDAPLLDGTDGAAPPSGTWRVGGTVTTSAGGDLTLTNNVGDIVVAGTIIAEDLGGNRANLTLSAPNGTVFISGAVLTAGQDGDSAGGLSILARRVVITGTVDLSGGDSSTAPGGTGGDLSIDAGAGDIFLVGATVLTDGGDGLAIGGNAGSMPLDADVGRVFLSGRFSLNGGAARETAASADAGDGGDLEIDSASTAFFDGSFEARGGEAATDGADAFGGDGGLFQTPGECRAFMYGSMNLRGGAARAASGAILGGQGGEVGIGFFGTTDERSTFARTGTPSIWARGGDAGAQGGGGGFIGAGMEGGVCRVRGVFDAGGGHGVAGDSAGGSGGDIEFRHPAFGGGSANGRPRQYEFQPGAVIRSDGGRGTGTSDGGQGGTIFVFTSADIVADGLFSAAGGDALDGDAGMGGDIDFDINAFAYGHVNVLGTLTVRGGASNDDDGGQGGNIDINTNGSPGTIEVAGLIDASGADSLNDDGGSGGSVVINASDGHVWVLGRVLATGGSGPSSVGGGGQVDIDASGQGGDFLLSGQIDVTGGRGTADGASGANGGTVTVNVNSANEPLVLSAGSSILADGGAGSGAASGGSGGSVTLTASNGPVTLAGLARARGGASPADAGGTGGSIRSFSGGGAITVAAGAVLDASGGQGATGGNALNDAVPAQATPGATAVELDADPANAAAPSGGTVVNNGSILANAGSPAGAGGDVLFDGNDGAGAAPAEGTQSRTGTPVGDYDNDVP